VPSDFWEVNNSSNQDTAGSVESGIKMALRPESEEQAKIRFQIELEFVQCLANPNYLNFLAQRGYLKDPSFVNYLKYLEYWKQPEYAKFLKYPMTLYFLDLLQYPEFRKEIANSKCAKFVEDQQLLHWQHYIRKRSKLVPGQTSQGGASGAEGGGPSSAPPPLPNSNNAITGLVTTPGLSSVASTVSSSSASGPSPAQHFPPSAGSGNAYTNK